MTIGILEAAQELLMRQEAKDEFASFALFMHRQDVVPIKHSKLQRLICKELQAVADGKQRFLLILLPPNSGKTTLSNRLFPAWLLGRNPDTRIITVSHTEKYAQRNSRYVRDYVRERQYQQLFPEMNLREDSQAAGFWQVHNRQGSFQATGWGGRVQGARADIVIADDLIGKREDAYSADIREKVWDSFGMDIMSRLEPVSGSVIMLATRYHVDDPPGRIIKNMKLGGRQWRVISLPAIAEIDDVLGRAPGEALWPEKAPLSELESIRTSGDLSERDWAAMYQQRPVSEGGSIINRKYWQIWDQPKLPEIDRIVLSLDPALKAKAAKDNDFHACSLWGVFRPPKIEYTWDEKCQLIRRSSNPIRDIALEFRMAPAIVASIKRGERVADPKTDGFSFLSGDGAIPTWKQVNPFHVILIDCWQVRCSYPELRTKFLNYIETWSPNDVVIEATACGPSLIDDLALAGITAFPYNPGREDKVTRANLVAGIWENQMVYAVGKRLVSIDEAAREGKKLGERSSVNFSASSELMITECEQFPEGTHDDLPDSAITAMHYLRQMRTFKIATDVYDPEDVPEAHSHKIEIVLKRQRTVS